MLKLFKYLLLVSPIILFQSCATKTKEVAKAPKVEKKEHSDNKKLALEAQKQVKEFIEKSDDNSEQIVGSSHIRRSSRYKGKTYYLYGAEHLKLENYYFDIPVVYNKAVKKWINYFVKRGRRFFARYSARAGRYAPLLGKILDDHGLPRDLIFLAMAESGFQNKAKSWAKAVGPWQFMPYTGKRFGLKIDWYIDERRDPIKSTIAASRYLKKLYEMFGSWELAAAGYNAGEGKIKRAIRRYRTENFWKIAKGRYLKSETKNYVPKIMALAIIGKNLKSFGFGDIEFNEPLDFEEINLKGNVDLINLADALGVPFEEIQRLNPEVLRWFTPHNLNNYTLRVPVGFKRIYSTCCSKRDFTAVAFQKYKIRGKRTRLRDVAKKFKIKKPYVLTYLNNKKAHEKLRRGSYIFIPFREGQSKKAPMYADLYDKPRKSVLRRRSYRKRIRLAKRRGRKINTPKAFYTVKKGDSLWSVSRKTGVSLDTIIASNLHIINHRMIRAGDRLVVR